PIKQIASKLVDLIRAKGRIETGSSTDDDLLQRILAHIRSKTGQDFSHYKRPTLTRRIARRMQVTHADGLTDYLAYLRGNAEEVQALFKDLLISVTSFFRDSHAYKTLAELVVPHLLEREKGRPIRVWVPGCATGEEAYSLAILILEEAAKQEAHVSLQVFASDLDAGALAAARAGRYSRAIETAVGPDRLARFFTLEGDYYCVRQELRDQVVFAAHGLLKDPPFSKLDLISCRNLMIYLDRELQEQACRTFHYALCPGGYLFLGTSETADHPPGLFRALDREARIYQANAHTRSPLPPLPTILPPTVTGVAKATRAVASSPDNDDASHRKALEQLGPPSMLVDAKLSILHLSESAGRYFQLPAGRPTNDAGSMVRPELRLDVQAGLHRAFEHDKRTVTLPIPVRFNGTAQAVVVQVTPIKEDGKVRKALVLFIEGGPTDPDLQVQGSSEASPVVVQLREQLLASKSMLRTTREQYDTAMEDLKAANEELQSINEEYRSTAEELETSKEELQSINEELQTLNNELKLKFDMVSRAHNDLQNLMGATDIATLFLDKEMRIKRFTPRTTDLFSIHVGDEGRPITDFTHRLEYEEFVADAQLVLRDLVPIERTIHTVDDLWLTTRLRPYRTLDDKIEGIVVTFFDITERRRADSAWAARQQMLLTESGHRIKNMLAVVHAIVFQTFKMSSGRADQDLCNLILDRLKALANTHDMLVHADWKSIKMHDLVQNQLAPYLANNRIAIEGPPVQIDAANAAPLGLILHELATNALK
ncbi:MAG: CheR family methyltransferase, partial [Nitrospira sp.]